MEIISKNTEAAALCFLKLYCFHKYIHTFNLFFAFIYHF